MKLIKGKTYYYSYINAKKRVAVLLTGKYNNTERLGYNFSNKKYLLYIKDGRNITKEENEKDTNKSDFIVSKKLISENASAATKVFIRLLFN